MTQSMKKWVLAVVLEIFLRSVVTGVVTTLSVAVKFIETYKMKRLKQSNLFECIKNKIGDCNMRKSSRILSGLVLGVIFLASIPIVVNAGAIFNPDAEVKIVGFPSETIANVDSFFTIVLTNKDVLTGIDSAHDEGAKVILKLDAGIFKSVELLSADGCDNCFDKYEGKGTSKLTIGRSFLAEGSSTVAIVRYRATKERGDITLTATGEIKGPDGYIDSDTATLSGPIVTHDYPIFSIKTLIETADRRGKFYNQSAELLETVLYSEKTLNEDMQNAWTNSMFWIMGLGAQMFMMPLQEPSTSAKALLKDGVESYLDVDGRITKYNLESTFSSIDRIIGKMRVDAEYRGRIYLLTKALNKMKAATDYEIKCWEDIKTHRSYLKLMFKECSGTMTYNEYDTIFDIYKEAHKLACDAEQKAKTEGRDVDFFVMNLANSIKAFANNDRGYIEKCEQLLDDLDNLEDDASKPDFTPLDLCMVLDRSGSMDESMGGKTRMQGVKEAATGVVNVLLPQDRVSIVPFSDTATANIDLTSDFSRVKTEINAIHAGGGTSFGAGLKAALDQFKDYGNPDHNPAILFMSDGEHNTAPDPEAYVTQCKNKGIPIFSVGFATSESEVDVTKLKMMAEETGGEYHFVSKNFNLQNIFLRLQHKASGWESVAAYVGEVDEGETVTAGTFYVDPAIDDLRVTLNWPGSNLDLELFDPSGRQVDFSASNVIYSGDTKPEYVIIKDPQSGYWTAKVYGKSIGSSEEYYVLVTKYEPEPTMDIQAEIRNIWTSDIISPIVLFGKDANLGQVLQADLDDDLFSDPLPSYDDRCLGDKNYDKSVISRFGEGDDKVRIVLDITGGTGFKPGSEGYIKILNPEYKITKIYDHSDYVGVQPPAMSLGTPTISTDYSGFGVVIDMEEGCVSWQGRGTCPACACRENTFRMEFLVEKVSIPADSVVIFADDFDSYATGSFPSSGAWNLKYNGMGDSYQIVDSSQSVSPPNSLKLEGEANWAASADHPLAETPDQVIYELDVKVTQPGSSVMNYHDAAIGLANPNIGTWGTRYAGVIFGNAENRVIQPGNIPFNFDQWYHIKVKADMNNGVYDVWLDDQLIASDISTSSNGDYTDIRLEGGNNAHTRVWFDNVNVYRSDYPSQDPNGGLNGVPDGNTITNTIGMEFVPIPPGEFEMGSPSDEEGRWSAEGPVHHVNIGYAFYMGRYGVTQKQWRAIMGDNPSYFKGDNLPVEQVSWYDAQEFIKKLNEKEITDKYRLPSEAEWEYACRAGTTSRYSFGNSESKLGDYAWYSDNSGDKTHPVGQKKPNSWELYDMYGNVREWVQDSWHDDYNGAPTDGSAWESGDSTFRVDRGGSWRINVKVCRSAFRGRYVQSSRYRALGFRLLREQ